MNDNLNILRIKIVYDALEELADEFIFVGGATVSLYADRLTTEIRPTDDIDIVVELLDHKGYAAIEEKLRSKGFANDTSSRVICRYIVKGITVDVMPTSEEILGFANRWYRDAAAHSIQKEIDSGHMIRLFSAPYFLATKLEAFKNRGKRDGRTSTDFEDIVYLLNNRKAIWQELKETPENLRTYLRKELSSLLNEPYTDEWVSVHLDYSEQRRVNYILGSIEEFVTH